MKVRRFTAYILLLLLFSFSRLSAQLVINEFSAANATVVADEFGKYGDWIEFYNAGNSPLNLYKYKLSDDPLVPAKWQFPFISLAPHDFITVFIDDTSKLTTINHWETPVKSDDVWRYTIPDNLTDTNWRNSSFIDNSWSQGKGGIGYGDGDDSTVVSNIRTIYMRKIFSLVDTSQVMKAIFNIDYDDGFVAYLNGIEIARNNIGSVGVRPNYTDFASGEHEAKMFSGGMPDSFYVDFNLLRKALQIGTNVLAVEVHNLSNASTDLSAIPYFSIGVNRSNYVFPAPPSWFEAPIREYLHANFKLSKSGETIVLSDSLGNVIDQKYTGSMQTDVSYGRSTDGAATWCFFSPPSPNISNSTSICYSGIATAPVFSIQGGYYDAPRLVSIAASPANAVIHYTTDGSTPTLNSAVYTSSLAVDTSQTLKARVYTVGMVPSPVVTNTYLIDEDMHLPVFSLATNPENLWDDSTGIYVLGNHASTTYPYKGANYWQDWEKPVSLEYFDKQKNRAFQFDAAFKINGNYSRAKPQKSFELILDNDFGTPEITYPLIPEKENIKSYPGFILRNAGTDWNVVHYRDGLMQRIMKNTYTGFLGYEPCEVFLNGRYWGVYEIRENDNHSYVENNFGYKKSEFDLLFEGGSIEIKNGSDTGFFNMFNYAITANPLDSSFYTKMNSLFDLQNYADYFIAETYYVNNDWIGDWSNNIKLWRPRKPGGKWQYILYDLDFGMGLYSSYTYDKLSDLIAPADDSYQSYIFNAMAANPTFRNYFINRYADLINTIYVPANVRKIAYDMRDSIAADMPLQFARWGSSMTSWNQNIASLINFTNKRPARALNYIQSNFNLNSQVVLTLQAYPLGSGRIQISTIIPDSLPWKGTYFNGNPVTITAIPNPGYSFDYWQPNNSILSADSNQSITINFTTSDSVLAYFKGSTLTPHITFNEINYQSAGTADAGDWVELHNLDSVDIDLTAWKFKDNDNLHCYTFPLGTTIKANGYLVLAEDLSKFNSQFPELSQNENHSNPHRSPHQDENHDDDEQDNVLGPIGFGFANTGELLRLFTNQDSLHVSMTYSKLPPWPIAAAGQGYTLESVPVNLDLDNGDNWFAGCPGGSPGTFFTPAVASILGDSLISFCEGDSVKLTAQSGSNFRYQWFKNGSEIQTAKNQNLFVSDSGDYTLKVNRFNCEAISAMVHVTKKTNPLAHIQSPLNTFVCAGATIDLTADSAFGQTFGWTKNDSILSGEVTAQLTLSDSGFYQVKVTDNGCTSVSELIHVVLNPLPDAGLQNDSMYSFCEGGVQTLSAPSNAAYTYKWYRNDTLLPAEVDTVFAATLSGKYSFETTLNGCSKQSNAIDIVVYVAPETFLNPTDTLVLCIGENHTLQAFFDSTYSYQWFFNDSLIVGADSATLFVDIAARYKLVTVNSLCSASSEVVVLIKPSPIATILADSMLSICVGTAYQLRVTKSLGYTYQWMKDSLQIQGATAFKYDVVDSGNYYAIVRLNSCESHSNTIQVNTHALPENVITANDTTNFCEGNFVKLESVGMLGLTYQWYRNGISIPGQTDTVFNANQSGNYTLVQRDSLCSNLSNSIPVTVKPSPLASATPSGTTHLCEGQSVFLNAPIDTNYSYQWLKDSSILIGFNQPLLSVADSGKYAVRVTLDGCDAVSAGITITQNQKIQASILAADTLMICANATYLFQTNVEPGMAYHWLLNGNLIPFATDSEYTASGDGHYAVMLSDAYCSATSTEKVLGHFVPTLVSLSSFSPVCVGDSAFELSGGTPLGGNYSGFAVDTNYFVPQEAGAGFNSISYAYIDSNNCTFSASSVIEVKAQVATPTILQNFDQLISSAVSGNQWYLNDTLLVGATQQVYVPTANGVYSLIVSDPQLCNSDTAYSSYFSLSAKSVEQELAFSIYPNPNNGAFTLTFSNKHLNTIAVKIFDMLSQEVYNERFSNLLSSHNNLNFSGIASGIYLIQVKSGDSIVEQKVIVH
ncbi:MAG: CotH kinase family protein [Bacteroidetes bacterium]|nr:CotH kinase family protein [Bacteroidota bacterium]